MGGDEYLSIYINDLVSGDSSLMAHVEKLKVDMGEKDFLANMRQLCLQIIDMIWVEHLEVMDYMRSSVRLRAYGQRDPLVEYKKEGLRLFKEIESTISDNILRLLPTIGAPILKVNTEKQALKEVHDSATLIGNSEEAQKEEIKKQEVGIGRNDPCICGSGKKYKKCCGK